MGKTGLQSEACCSGAEPSTRISSLDVNAASDEKASIRSRASGLAPLASRLRFSLKLNLKNTGSVARDHLALERTFLAYTRTSLAIVTAGVAILQLFASTSPSNYINAKAAHRYYIIARTLAACTIVLGMIVLLIGAQRYFSIQTALTAGKFPAARLSSFVIVAALMALTVATFGIMLSGNLAL